MVSRFHCPTEGKSEVARELKEGVPMRLRSTAGLLSYYDTYSQTHQVTSMNDSPS